MLDRERRQPIKQTLAPRQLCDRHHADQEEVDVQSLAGPSNCVGPWQKTETYQRDRAGDGPDGLRKPERPRDNPKRRDGNDRPRGDGFMRSVHRGMLRHSAGAGDICEAVLSASAAGLSHCFRKRVEAEQGTESRNTTECQECRAVTGMHDDKTGERRRKGCPNTLRGNNGTLRDVEAARVAHEVSHDDRKNRSEYPGTDSIEQLHADQPKRTI